MNRCDPCRRRCDVAIRGRLRLFDLDITLNVIQYVHNCDVSCPLPPQLPIVSHWHQKIAQCNISPLAQESGTCAVSSCKMLTSSAQLLHNAVPQWKFRSETNFLGSPLHSYVFDESDKWRTKTRKENRRIVKPCSWIDTVTLLCRSRLEEYSH